MTAYSFTPSDNATFQFQPTLDGTIYTVSVTWNVWGRYYVNINTVQGVLVYCMPLIGSPPNYNISLLPPLNPQTGKPWISTFYYVEASRTFVVTP